jgi:hypothetical protein
MLKVIEIGVADFTPDHGSYNRRWRSAASCGSLSGMKKPIKKLSLAKQTIAQLTVVELGAANGAGASSNTSTCVHCIQTRNDC